MTGCPPTRDADPWGPGRIRAVGGPAPPQRRVGGDRGRVRIVVPFRPSVRVWPPSYRLAGHDLRGLAYLTDRNAVAELGACTRLDLRQGP